MFLPRLLCTELCVGCRLAFLILVVHAIKLSFQPVFIVLVHGLVFFLSNSTVKVFASFGLLQNSHLALGDLGSSVFLVHTLEAEQGVPADGPILLHTDIHRCHHVHLHADNLFLLLLVLSALLTPLLSVVTISKILQLLLHLQLFIHGLDRGYFAWLFLGFRGGGGGFRCCLPGWESKDFADLQTPPEQKFEFLPSQNSQITAANSNLLGGFWHFVQSSQCHIAVGRLLERKFVVSSQDSNRVEGLNELAGAHLLELCVVSFLITLSLAFLDFGVEHLGFVVGRRSGQFSEDRLGIEESGIDLLGGLEAAAHHENFGRDISR